MNSLITALINKNAFIKDTVISANYETRDLFGRTYKKSGDFKIRKILKSGNNFIFDLIGEDGNEIIKTGPESITMVDGMDLSRFADTYNIMTDGTSKNVGKKRGRKSKLRT
jgi:hypothetical protein